MLFEIGLILQILFNKFLLQIFFTNEQRMKNNKTPVTQQILKLITFEMNTYVVGGRLVNDCRFMSGS